MTLDTSTNAPIIPPAPTVQHTTQSSVQCDNSVPMDSVVASIERAFIEKCERLDRLTQDYNALCDKLKDLEAERLHSENVVQNVHSMVHAGACLANEGSVVAERTISLTSSSLPAGVDNNEVISDMSLPKNICDMDSPSCDKPLDTIRALRSALTDLQCENEVLRAQQVLLSGQLNNEVLCDDIHSSEKSTVINDSVTTTHHSSLVIYQEDKSDRTEPVVVSFIRDFYNKVVTILNLILGQYIII